MRQEKLMDAMEFVSDELLESAADSMAEKKKRLHWKPLATMAACLALIAGLSVYSGMVPDDTKPAVPKYENAIFSAQQIADLFSVKDGVTNAYTKKGYPNESMLILPGLPEVEYLNVYQYTGEVAEKAELEELINKVFPVLEKMYDIDIPECEIEQSTDYYVGGYEYDVDAIVEGKWITASNSHMYQGVSWWNGDRSALPINGVTLQATGAQTDKEVMESVSTVIPYLEQIFDMDLSAYKIIRYYSNSNSSFYGMDVYLYSEGQVTDPLLEQYNGETKRYCDGDMLCLNFERMDRNSLSDIVVCRRMRYVRSIQQRHKTYAQCKMISLEEAEALLENGYVFSNHVCKLCMAAQEIVDFSDYDKVSLEYVFDYGDINGYGIPFYTFYKKIREDEDGFVQYAKTMVPAIEVSGLEEYFEEQQKYHRSW